jgi:hypothetical protein
LTRKLHRRAESGPLLHADRPLKWVPFERRLTAQGHAQKDRRANRLWPVGPHRQPRRHLPTPRMRQLLQLLRI